MDQSIGIGDQVACLSSGKDPLSIVRNADLPALAEAARDYARDSRSSATRRAYASDWEGFEEWCQARGFTALPAAPATVGLYLTDRATVAKVSTLGRQLVSIRQAHKAAGHEDPTKAEGVRLIWRGVRRSHGTAQHGKAPVLTADVKRMADGLPDTMLGHRDRALILLGFSGAFRRSELVALDRQDIEAGADGLTVTVRRSKTDQEGEGRKVGIPFGSTPGTCPVRSVLRWVEVAGITSGPVFRSVNRHGHVQPDRLSAQVVALVVKKLAEAAGMDPSQVAGHSLRAGLATSAAAAGVSERVIAKQTGHKSMAVLRRYIRDGELFRENAAAAVGL